MNKSILHRANIITMDPAMPRASALVIQGSRVVATGSEEEILAFGKGSAELIDMKGQTILPGLSDAHLHLEHYALGLQKVDCETDTKEECLVRIAHRADTAPQGAWIEGHGFNQNTWPGNYGNAVELDAVSVGHPVYITAKSLHAGWANSAALQLAGIGENTPDPPGGAILRGEDGRPTGILLESASLLVEKVLPNPTDRELAVTILSAQEELWKMGLTAVHDFDSASCFRALQLLQSEQHLGLRVVKSIPYENLEKAIGLGLKSGFGNDFLRIGSLKLFADGALGQRTAAMLEPYERDQKNAGSLLIDSEELFEIGRKAVSAGISLAVHAIGDRANHEILDGFEQLRKFERSEGFPSLRHRIEHVQLLHDQDLPRLANLDLIASMQPIHSTSDMMIADRYWGNRSSNAYAFQALKERGTRIVFGSDAPVEVPNPFWGIHAAVTRRRQNGDPGLEGWYPHQRISLQAAFEAYTVEPAQAAGMEICQGRLSPGYFADLIVIEQDPFKIPPQDLFQLKPTAVMTAGEWVWHG